MTTIDQKKSLAADWFRDLRDQICASFEAIEAEYEAAHPKGDSEQSGERQSQRGASPPSDKKFTITPWSRDDGGSGEMGMMKGRVFEKVGVNISVVHGEFSEQFRHEIPGAAEDPRFWAAGISLVAHMASPLVPAAHFNTRMILVGADAQGASRPRSAPPRSPDGSGSPSGLRTDDGSAEQETINARRAWFGGGGDLNPMFENPADTADFHAAFREACDQTDPRFYDAFKAWCDEYFFIPHRGEARGVGGIFYDYLGLNRFGADTSPVTSGRFGKGGVTKENTLAGMKLAADAELDWAGGFAFTQEVGRAFASIYPALIRRHMFEPWTDAQRHHQLVKRGRYAEYNLLYDRGTRFGLMTGGNAEAILMSLPPVAIWE